MDRQIRILILEDDPADVELAKRELHQAGLDFSVDWAADKEAFLCILDASAPDLILADYSVPGFDGMAALTLAKERFPDVPVIIVSGVIRDEAAIEMLKAGAADYVLKNALARLRSAVPQALEEAQQAALRRQLEAALRESEEHFRVLAQTSPDGILATDEHGVLTFVNAALEETFDIPASEAIGTHFSKYLTAESIPKAQEVFLACMNGQIVKNVEVSAIHRDGHVFPIEIAASPILRSGQFHGVECVVRDITQRKQAEEALQRALTEAEDGRNTLNALMEYIPMGITIADAPDVNIRMVSKYGQDLLERAESEIAHIPAPEHPSTWGIYHADGVTPGTPEDLPLTRAVVNGEVVRNEEWIVARRDGTLVPVLCNAAPIRDKQGDVIGGVVGWQDITDRKRAEEALRKLTATLDARVARRTAELERRTRQLQKLALDLTQAEDRERKRLADLLHDDLQQQLAAAKFHLRLLGNRVQGDASLREATARVDELLKDAIAKSRNLSHELSPAMLYHGDFGEALEWLASQIQTKHGLTVHVDVRGRIEVSSDPIRAFLFRTTQEILFNIVKHAGVTEAGVRLRRRNGQVWLGIRDRGRGFDPNALGQVVGLGLLNIRERVELLGGRMKIRSTPGRGSTFLIAVPDDDSSSWRGCPALASRGHPGLVVPGHDAHDASDQSEQDIPTPGEQGRDALATAEPHAENRLRVLLVDDHKIVREGLATLLNEQKDIKVVSQATNGREAVDLAHELHPDVVVMDMAMPVMEGDEATRRIKSDLPETRVVGLSMFDEPAMIERMHLAGAERYMLKTAPSEDLLAAIRDG